MGLAIVFVVVIAVGLVTGFFEEHWDRIEERMEINRLARESRKRMLSDLPNRCARRRNPMRYGLTPMYKK